MPLSTYSTHADLSSGSWSARYGCGIRRVVLLVGFALAIAASFASAQWPPSPSSSAGSADQQSAGRSGALPDAVLGSSAESTDEHDLSGNGAALSTPAALSADQIIEILQQNPNLTADIKSMAAERLEQQGTQVDPSNISDEMLFSQISANASLRSSITTYLRARGYVTEDETASARFAAAGGDAGEDLRDAARTGATQNSPDGSRRASHGAASTSKQLFDGNQVGTSAAGAGGARLSRGAMYTNASTDLPQVVHRPTPYDLRSMRDLYAQIPSETGQLKRFGSELFLDRNISAAMRGAGSETQLDVPLGPDYVLGPGDTIEIDIWGGVTQTFARMVERDGRVLLPEAGSLQVAGVPLGRAQDLIGDALKSQFRDARVAVTVSRLHSVRIYVVGDVQRPGGYDLSSLSTPLSALYAAGGPTSVGSLRVMHHMRGDHLVEDVDLYDFLLHGIRSGSARFESGDTLQIPPAGPQVAISGAVKRPAIYELKSGETSLASVIDDAGGLTPAASLSHVTVERIDANQQRETVTLQPTTQGGVQPDRSAVSAFQIKDGDRIRIEPILPYSERAIYLEGHVVRPGRFSYTDGMRLSDVLHSYRDLLPEPAAHGEIVRPGPT